MGKFRRSRDTHNFQCYYPGTSMLFAVSLPLIVVIDPSNLPI